MAPVMPQPPVLVARGSPGVRFSRGIKCEKFDGPPEDSFSDCRGFQFSADGGKFAWATSAYVKVAETVGWSVVFELQMPKVAAVKFSPTADLLCVWHPFFVSNEKPNGSPNMHIYDLNTKECIKQLTHKKYQTWELQWSSDGQLCARSVSNEVHFFEGGDFSSVPHKLRMEGLTTFSVSPGVSTHVVGFVPSISGRPAGARLYKYPQLSDDSALARKSFFKADSCSMKWNCRGSTCLLLASTETDTTGQSYYGETSLYGLDSRGGSVHIQPGAKKGPVYAFEWSPSGTEFCLVYGFMPAKATLFNVKYETVFEFEPAHRNSAHYNPHGNMLILFGSGNVRGQLEVWDVQKRRLLARGDCPDTTELHWCPDGQHFSAATCSPRLREGNGYRIWHYSLSLQHEHNMTDGRELYETCWQPIPVQQVNKPSISSNKVSGIESTRVAPAAAYIPPVLREMAKLAPGNRRKMPIPGMAPAEPATEKKTKSKSKKAGGGGMNKQTTAVLPQTVDEPFVPPSAGEIVAPSIPSKPATKPVDDGAAERRKKREAIKKKLKDIAKLKTDRAGGKQLNAEQLEKLAREQDLSRDLKALAL